MSAKHRSSLPLLLFVALPLSAAAVLFPNNLHLTRQIDDPVSGKTTTIEEYYSGNRVASVSGDHTVLVDYDKQEITEIDRHAGTYSVSRFDEVASAIAANGATSKAAPRLEAAGPQAAQPWKITSLGTGLSPAGRSVDQFELVDAESGGPKVEVGIDRSVGLSREAVEVLIGAAYPNPVRREHEPVLRAAESRASRGAVASDSTSSAAAQQTYGLPLTQAFTYTDSGTEVTFRTVITRIGAEAIPASALIIPPGAKRVESRATALRRQLRELDQLAPSPNPREN